MIRKGIIQNQLKHFDNKRYKIVWKSRVKIAVTSL